MSYPFGQPRTWQLSGTARQMELLRFVAGYIEAKGYAPSVDEMADGIGISNKSGIIRLLDSLEERGLVFRIRNRARGVTVLAHPPIPRAPGGAPMHFVPIKALAA